MSTISDKIRSLLMKAEETGKELHQPTVAAQLGCTQQLVSKVVRQAREAKERVYNDKPQVILAFGDTHFPAVHPGYLPFLQSLVEEWGVTDIVHTGDLIDSHAISRHSTETTAMNSREEVLAVKEKVKAYVKAFPNMKLCYGNHDQISCRMLKTLNIDSIFLKTLNELYELPDTWVFADNHQVNGVLFSHGLEAGGQIGFKNAAIHFGMSYVCGHTHSTGGVLYHENGIGRTIFGANTGAGLDDSLYNFYYSKTFKNKTTLGAVIVTSPTQAYFVSMPKEFRDIKG